MKDLDRPAEDHGSETLWGSDALAEMLRRLGVTHVALNPGSSFRGLHDSLVNHLGNRDPQMLLCLHEEHAVAMAHGWAKITGRPMAVILHANVGLMHASMALYNAWCDRVPMLVLGATGPVDADRRRPWIDWIHTSRDQAALVRPFVKWDDQPASLPASLDGMMRAWTITRTPPMAPTYVCFDVSVQEEAIEAVPSLPDPDRFRTPAELIPAEHDLHELANWLESAQNPVFLMGRVSRDPEDWDRRVALAERVGARVVTDIKTGATFPTRHPAHVGAPAFFTTPEAREALQAADVIVSFDWVDLGGTLKAADLSVTPRVVQISLDSLLANGWSLDHQAMAPADMNLLAEPDAVIAGLCSRMSAGQASTAKATPRALPEPKDAQVMDLPDLAAVLADVLRAERPCHIRLPLGWDGAVCDFHHPLDYLGYDGGAGIGSGPGMAVGAALALEGGGRLPVAVLGDGDFLMGATAIWTAARYGIPLLIVVANNRSYFNDEVHQERVARDRSRRVENKHIGQAIADPDIDIASMARSQGAIGYGPVSDPKTVGSILRQAVGEVRDGSTVVVDCRILPGYDVKMAKGMTE